MIIVVTRMVGDVSFKHSSFWPSANGKPMSNDLVHVMPWQGMFVLSMCTECSK